MGWRDEGVARWRARPMDRSVCCVTHSGRPVIDVLRRPSWRGAGALRWAATRRRGPNHSDHPCLNAFRLLFCKRAPKAYCRVRRDCATVDARRGGGGFRPMALRQLGGLGRAPPASEGWDAQRGADKSQFDSKSSASFMAAPGRRAWPSRDAATRKRAAGSGLGWSAAARAPLSARFTASPRASTTITSSSPARCPRRRRRRGARARRSVSPPTGSTTITRAWRRPRPSAPTGSRRSPSSRRMTSMPGRPMRSSRPGSMSSATSR